MCNLWDKNVTQYKDEIDNTDIETFFDGKTFDQTVNVGKCANCQQIIIKTSEDN